MHRLLALLIAFIGLFHAPTYPQVIDRAQASVIRITGEKEVMTMFGPQHGSYTCTGEVIAPNRVLTADHCIGDDMLADGVRVTAIVKENPATDLALLNVETKKPALLFRDVPVLRFEIVSGIGYAWGLNRLSVLEERVFLTNVIAPDDNSAVTKILVQPGYIGGMSGGPIVDKDGLMVGIIQESGDGVGLGADIVQIRAFLEGVI